MNICSIDDCGKKVVARGMCSAHWQRWRRYGDARTGATTPGAALRFLESTFAHFQDDCILWPFPSASGYARVRYYGRSEWANRIVCERFNGKPPTPTHDSAHSCGKGHLGCINGYHLRWATRKENLADMALHGTSWAARRAVGKFKTSEPYAHWRKTSRPINDGAA